MTHVLSRVSNHNGAGKQHFRPWILLEKIVNGLEAAGQVLFITVQISKDVTLRSLVSTVDGVIHPLVFFNVRFYASVVRQPFLGAVVRAGILHDVFDIDPFLVRDGCNAEFQPFCRPKAGGDYGQTHAEWAFCSTENAGTIQGTQRIWR